MANLSEYEGAAEVILTKKNIEVTCAVYADDETLLAEPSVDSVSVRGAQREITAWLLGLGYEFVGRWEWVTPLGAEEHEAVRVFRRKAEVAA
jgi:hypothetical protein